jgi:hypothetical protein
MTKPEAAPPAPSAPSTTADTGPALEAEQAKLHAAQDDLVRLMTASPTGDGDDLFFRRAGAREKISHYEGTVKVLQDAHVEATVREAVENSNRWARSQRPPLEAHDRDISDLFGELDSVVDRIKSAVSRRDSTVHRVREEAHSHLASDLVRNDPVLGITVDGYRLTDNHRQVGATAAGIVAPLLRFSDNPGLAANVAAMAGNTLNLWSRKSVEVSA